MVALKAGIWAQSWAASASFTKVNRSVPISRFAAHDTLMRRPLAEEVMLTIQPLGILVTWQKSWPFTGSTSTWTLGQGLEAAGG